MPSVNIYTFREFGGSTSRGIDVSDADAEALLEAETTASEKRIVRTRVPYRAPISGDGYQIGDGSDPTYEIVLLERR
jgi:hypothetical protein